jgi:hypothetical protein
LAFRASSHRAVNAIETPSPPCVQISVEICTYDKERANTSETSIEQSRAYLFNNIGVKTMADLVFSISYDPFDVSYARK